MNRRRALPFLMSLALAACGTPRTADERPVVRIDGEVLTRGDFEAYLQLNLAGVEGSADLLDESENDLVRSRLLDAWIEERLILAEAVKRRLTISDDSLDPLLDNTDMEFQDDDRATRRDSLRKRLMIEMLQGQVLQDIVLPTVEEARAWLESRPEAGGTGKRVELRALKFDDPDRAKSVHLTLRRDNLTFDEVVLLSTEDETQAIPTVVDWDTLPPEVREATERLRAGWSSTPVEIGDGTYLFQVVRWIESAPEKRVERTREQMFRTARRAAWEAFVDGLRERATVVILEENLTFKHVSASAD